MIVRLTQVDGKLPNLALMKLAHWHRSRGDDVHFTRSVNRGLFEPKYDRVYASAIFSFSAERLARLKTEWPDAIVGGTGAGDDRTVEQHLRVNDDHYEHYDYSIYPDYKWSLGFTQRGCRLKCKFCVVPAKEGKPRSVNTIADIWREGAPRKLHLLDNDFFGQPESSWRARVDELRAGRFKVCLNQGINIRLINADSAAALASLEYRDDQFLKRRLYTAWDNLKDEAIFFRGVDTLEKAGVKPNHLMVYMLVGFAPDETMDRVFYRFERMRERGIYPYPMVFDRRRKDLLAFQRWVITGLYRIVPWTEYRHKQQRAADTSAPLLEQKVEA